MRSQRTYGFSDLLFYLGLGAIGTAIFFSGQRRFLLGFGVLCLILGTIGRVIRLLFTLRRKAAFVGKWRLTTRHPNPDLLELRRDWTYARVLGTTGAHETGRWRFERGRVLLMPQASAAGQTAAVTEIRRNALTPTTAPVNGSQSTAEAERSKDVTGSFRPKWRLAAWCLSILIISGAAVFVAVSRYQERAPTRDSTRLPPGTSPGQKEGQDGHALRDWDGLTLADGEVEHHLAQPASAVEVTLDLEFEPLKRDGDVTETHIGLSLSTEQGGAGSYEPVVKLIRRKSAGKTIGEVVISWTSRRYQLKEGTTDRQFAPPQGVGDGSWTIGYRYGFIYVDHEGERIGGWCRRYSLRKSRVDEWPIVSVRLRQANRKTNISRPHLHVINVHQSLSQSERSRLSEATRAVSLAATAQLSDPQAIASVARSLRVMREIYADEHPELGDSICILGDRHGRGTERGEPHARLGCEMLRRTLGADHPYYLARLSGLVDGYWSMQDIDLAISLEERKHESLERNRRWAASEEPADYSDRWMTCRRLAGFYLIVGDHPNAARLEQQAIQNAGSLKFEDPDTLNLNLSRLQLAHVYRLSGRDDHANKLYRDARYQMRQTLSSKPSDWRNRSSCLMILAEAAEGLGLFDEAETYHAQCVAVTEATQGEGAGYITVNQQLARFYFRMGEYEKALGAYQEALNIDPTMPEVYKSMALVYLRSGDVPRAVAMFRKVSELDPADETANIFLYGPRAGKP